jgi:hypothetical protein
MIIKILDSTEESRYRKRTLKHALYSVLKNAIFGDCVVITEVIDMYNKPVAHDALRMSISKICLENNIVYKTKVNELGGINVFIFTPLEELQG